ncbi:hypothetical protein CEXT_746591, partial [Caerostris extrusa]
EKKTYFKEGTHKYIFSTFAKTVMAGPFPEEVK